MATTLYLKARTADAARWSNGVAYTRIAGGSGEWEMLELGTTRGGSSTVTTTTNTVNGPTGGLEAGGSYKTLFVSPPLSAAVTISGSISFAAWANESSMSANAAVNYRIMSASPSGLLTHKYSSLRTTELGTSGSANNWSETPGASFSFNKGDRIVIIPFFDDAGTMGIGYTVTIFYNGPTAGAAGDSYVTFNETFSFASDAAGTTLYLTDTDAALLGTGTSEGPNNPSAATSEAGPGNGWTTPSNVYTDNANVSTVQLSVSEVPETLFVSGFGFAIPAGAVIQGIQLDVDCASDTLSHSLWCDLQYGGSMVGATREITVATGVLQYQTTGGSTDLWTYTGWTAEMINDSTFGVDLSLTDFGTDTIYVDHVRIKVFYAMPIDREMWTSRGAGVANDVVNTVAGQTAPIQLTDTAGGSIAEWWSKGLTAFTLAGKVRVSLRGLESNALANATLRAELAVANNNGGGATVWAVSTPGVELGTSEGTLAWDLAGADVSVSNGQRLRLRVYIDDAYGVVGGVMATGYTATAYYAGAAGATGDAFIVLTQTVTEYSSGTPVGKSVQAIWNARAPIGKSVQAIWHERAKIGKSLQAIFNVKTFVGKSVQAIFNVKTFVGKSVQAVWHVRAAPGKALQAVFHVRANVGKSVQAVWNVKTFVGKAVQAVFHVRGAVGKSVQAVWNVKAVVGKSVQAVFHVLQLATAVGKEVVLQWKVRAPVAKSVQAVFHVRAAIGKSVQQIWHVRAAVGKAVQAIWKVAAPVGKAVQAIFKVAAPVGKSVQAIWNVRAAVGKSLQAPFHVRAFVGKSVQMVYMVYISAAKTLQTPFHVRAAVGKSVQAVFHVRAAVGKSVQAVFHVLQLGTAAVGKSVQVIWHMRAPVAKTIEARWNVNVFVGKSVQVVFHMRAPVAKTLQAVFNVRTSAAKTLQQIWMVRAAVGKGVEARWKVRVFVGKAIEAQWRVRQAAGDTFQAIFNVRANVAKTLQANWAVRAFVGKSVQAVWKVREAASAAKWLIWHVAGPYADPSDMNPEGRVGRRQRARVDEK